MSKFKEKWLPQLLDDFTKLDEEDREETVKALLEIMGPKEKWFLQTALPDLLFRDFVTTLPVEILEHILSYLEIEDIVNCCMVSKVWNNHLSKLSLVWKGQATNQGMKMNPKIPPKDWKSYALYGKRTIRQLKKGSCFTHLPKNHFVKEGTYVSALSMDKNFVAAATCDPANVDRPEEGQEKLLLFDLEEMNVVRTVEVPMFVSCVKLIYGEYVIIGHFDGNLSLWNFEDESLASFKGHPADILAVDFNQVKFCNAFRF